MLTKEKVVTIHVLRKQGHTIQGIAKELGISRNTVKKYLERGIDYAPRYSKRAAKPSKLDPYKTYLQRRVAAAAPDWIPAPVLYEEIKAQGYTGKLRMVNYYLATLKPQPAADPVVRFETLPGQQLQVDFTTIRAGKQPLKAFVATLGYSRASFACFYDNERTESWLDGLRRCFEFFGGVPHEVLFDNAKSIVIERDAYGPGEHRWNPTLLDLAKTYGFRPRLCRPYRAKTKGKVERFNRYLKGSFVTPLVARLKECNLILDVDLANAHIGRWLVDTANARVHDTTKQIPAQQLQEELPKMLALPVIAAAAACPDDDSGIPSVSRVRIPIPFESLQHPLSIYDQVVGGEHELTV
ncbi:IS21 family transposase [Oligella urethralis]|uniref:IS21 family transposase n=1 Tax=Oligella urethralis TaxID=90245 RepID=UPI002551A41E|nr:IS21 family transposase [Oligella urethralis]MDK6203698.1 IS21 family transposase [Oligella urethralis]